MSLGSPARGGDPDAIQQTELLRERLTEREDKRRPPDPIRIDVAGRPLTFSGEYEIEVVPIRRRVVGGEPVRERDRVLLAQGLEAEVFYTWGPVLSAFAQVRFGMEEDLLPDTVDAISDVWIERGEMWLYSENILGTGVNADIGRLDFEDDRRWWWDEELDAVRLAWEGESVEIALALASEFASNRSDRDELAPEDEDQLRVIGEASWDWDPAHSLQLFVLHENDASSVVRLGDVVVEKDEDPSDADLTWIGARAMGMFETTSHASGIGYWVDAAWVGGREHLDAYETDDDGAQIVGDQERRSVRGWALDVGLNWMPKLAFEPRLFAGYALGSGDPDADAGTDRSFRQSSLAANEAGFGGVERFPSYGVLLDPELSNLGVATLGAGISLFRSSSLDLVYHRYDQIQAASSLGGAGLDLAPTGTHRDLGQELDLVLAVEEWDHLEFAVAAAVFRSGRALGDANGTWSAGGLVAIRWAF